MVNWYEALITLMVFDTDLTSLLTALRKGDSLSAIGAASIRAYADKERKPAAGVTLMVNRLMVMVEGKAATRPRGNGQRRTRDHHSPAPELPPLNTYPELFQDKVPF